MRAEVLAAAALAVLLGPAAADAQMRLPNVERFTATTAAMTPSDIGLRIDVREWSDDAARAAVIAALADEANASKALGQLPTIGYVWQEGSGVGYAVKYAHRVAADGGERVTFVTDRRLGSYAFKPWTANGGAGEALGYSVIELYLDDEGHGNGTMSLGAEVRVDEASSTVSLEASPDAPRLLTDAKLEPKPYWADGT